MNEKLQIRVNGLLCSELYYDVRFEYDKPHRYYHNWNHICALLESADKENILSDELILAIIFHDICYDPKSSENEEMSAKLFDNWITYHHGKSYDEVYNAILETKHHKPITKLGKQLCRLDLEILNSDFKTFIEFEEAIFKEYQFVDYKIYKEERVKILRNLKVKEEYIQYVENRKPKIGVYAGSFNPFHKGHLNILNKAEKIFDKVIIAKGNNPIKEKTIFNPPSSITNRQIETYDGLLVDFLDSLGYEVTLIRGIRDSNDLQYELIQHRYNQDFKEDINTVSIFCDVEYQHISSSAIRMLEAGGNPIKNYLVD